MKRDLGFTCQKDFECLLLLCVRSIGNALDWRCKYYVKLGLCFLVFQQKEWVHLEMQ